MKKHIVGAFTVAVGIWLFTAFTVTKSSSKQHLQYLSEYGFFGGDLAEQKPVDGVFEYTVNAPLFSDYAHKQRFIRLPEGIKMTYHPTETFEFPEGSAIIKTFYYYKDERKPEKGKRLMETRVLLKKASAWVALPYVWKEDQSDAELAVIGSKQAVEWKDAKGKKQVLDYRSPNMNQCKGCHNYDQALRPIGPSARQLNKSIKVNAQEVNQLSHWESEGWLTELPQDNIPVLVDYLHKGHDLNTRARSYLDGNCSYCHQRKGPADTSGLFLRADEEETAALGINKAPIAAGRGSGNRQYSIAPGKPNESILLYRMQSDDPGIRMPEIGRQVAHKEGVALIEEWIKTLK